MKKARSNTSLLKRFLRTAMNQEPRGDSTTGPLDSCSRTLAGDKEQRNNVPATPSWTDVPSSAFLVRKPIPRKPIIAAKVATREKRRARSSKSDHKSDNKVATREKRRARSSKSDHKSDNKSDSTKKSKKPLPNAFVSVRIPSAEIRDKLQEIQEAIVARDNKLQSTLVSLDKLHLTLFVIRLESEAEVERARVALLEATQRVTAEMKLLSSPIVLEFGGVGSFSRRVVFASIKEGPAKERLTSAADMVRSIFETHGICSTDGRSFNPHLTIAKVSRSSGRERIYGIEKEVYSEFTDTELGSEVVTGFELLSMVEPAAADGYYHCLQRYTFEEMSTSSQWTYESCT